MIRRISPGAGSGVLLAVLILAGSPTGYAGTKDLVATKRDKYTDDSVESMRDVFARKEAEEDEFRKKVLANSEQTVLLLAEIRNLLIQLNAKKDN